ncbi:MAG: OadG family protein [Clostridia bacterium]|jgi:Na+-transporting methylmalonyl-CoA/oxaloacetate decarboxylase gamma subunit
MEVNQMFIQGLKLMGVGVSTVFCVLLLFFVAIKLLMKLFPNGNEQ